MKEVKLSLINIQSHKNTSIIIKPGLTLLVAKDNNVGKSTVFRALDLIAQVQNTKPEDIRPLIRFGCERGIISCEFDNQVVELHIFLRNTTVGYYFLHKKDDVVTQLDKAPADAIQALNLIAPTNINQTLNIVEADKYQVVIEEGGINDSVISFLFTDQMVEHIKQNADVFNSMLVSDEKFYSITLAREQEKFKALEYNPCVDKFNEDKKVLSMLCNFIDRVPNYQDLRNLNSIFLNTEILDNVIEITEKLEQLNLSLKTEVIPMKEIIYLYKLLRLLNILKSIKKILNDNFISLSDISYLKEVFNRTDKLSTLYTLLMEKGSLVKEKVNLQKQLSNISNTIICPVKGRVIYNEERCIPISD